MNLRFGLFIIRNGHLQFKQAHHEYKIGDKTVRSPNVIIMLISLQVEGSDYEAYSMVGSVHRNDLSVRTPSLAGTLLT